MNPLISIIIPMKNYKKQIVWMLNSIQEQTYDNIEIIIAYDTKSTDNGLFTIENYESKHPITILQGDDSSIGEARNRGLKQAKGEFVWFCDADDEIFPTACEELVKPFLENESLNISGGAWCPCKAQDGTGIYKCYQKALNKNKKTKGYHMIEHGDAMYNLWAKHDLSVTAWAYLFRRSYLFENNIWFNNYSHGEDIVFVLESLKYTDKIAKINQFVYFYKVHSNSASHEKDDELNFWNKHIPYFDDCFKLLAHEYPSIQNVQYNHFMLSFVVELTEKSKEEYHKYIEKYKIKSISIIPKDKLRNTCASLLFNISPELFRIIIKRVRKLRGDVV